MAAERLPAPQALTYGSAMTFSERLRTVRAGPHNRAVAPSNGRRLRAGDIVLAEITPSYRGPLVQICRTVVLGAASATLAEKYRLVVRRHDGRHRGGPSGRPDGGGVPRHQCHA